MDYISSGESWKTSSFCSLRMKRYFPIFLFIAMMDRMLRKRNTEKVRSVWLFMRVVAQLIFTIFKRQE